MNKRCAGMLLLVAAATAVCLGQAGSSPLSQPTAPMEGAKTAALSNDTTVGPSFQQRYPRYKLEFGDQFDVSF